MTAEDQAALTRQRARELQRQRRAKQRRIDYYPSEAAAAVIDALCDAGQKGRDRSSVIDHLVLRGKQRFDLWRDEVGRADLDNLT